MIESERLVLGNSHSSSGTIFVRNRVEVGGTIQNYSELICCVNLCEKKQCEIWETFRQTSHSQIKPGPALLGKRILYCQIDFTLDRVNLCTSATVPILVVWPVNVNKKIQSFTNVLLIGCFTGETRNDSKLDFIQLAYFVCSNRIHFCRTNEITGRWQFETACLRSVNFYCKEMYLTQPYRLYNSFHTIHYCFFHLR